MKPDTLLNRKRLFNLKTKRVPLIKKMKPDDDLLRHLADAKCISWRHRESIELLSAVAKRNTLILDILRRRSMADYDNFVISLTITKQDDVVEILDEDSGKLTINMLFNDVLT
jgi:hypothetical protein